MTWVAMSGNGRLPKETVVLLLGALPGGRGLKGSKNPIWNLNQERLLWCTLAFDVFRIRGQESDRFARKPSYKVSRIQ